MAIWRDVKKTQKGLDWAAAGEGVIITGVVIGGGISSIPTEQVTALENFQQNAAILEALFDPSKGFSIKYEFSSSDAPVPYSYNELGVVAKGADDPTETEYLYVYTCVENGEGVEIDPDSTPVQTMRDYLVLKAVNSEDITIEISDADFATKGELSAVAAEVEKVELAIAQHANKVVASEGGAHDFRIDNNIPQYSTDGGQTWVDIAGGGDGGQVGDIIASPAPSRKGSLLCDGTEYDATEYPKLAKISSDFDITALVENVNADPNNAFSATATYSGSAAQAFDDNDSSYWRLYSGAVGDYYLTCEYAEAKEIEALRFLVSSYSTSGYDTAIQIKDEAGNWSSISDDWNKYSLNARVANGILTIFVNLNGLQTIYGVRLRVQKLTSSSSSFYVYSFQAGKIATFKTPNLRDRTIFGANQSYSKFVGRAYGALSVALTVSNLASHTHSTSSHTHTVALASYVGSATVVTTTGGNSDFTSGPYAKATLASRFSTATSSSAAPSVGAAGSGTAVNIENANVRMNYFIIHGEN